MKNKGFTLVELLAIIGIMGVIIVLTGPMMLSALNSTKKQLKKYDLQGVEDAGRMYINDLDEGIIEYTYTGTEPIYVNNHRYAPGSVIKGYDLKVHLIKIGGIDVTMETLVAGGYYDKNCRYAGTIVNGVALEKDERCHLPKTCTLHVSIDHVMSKDGAYYVTNGYKAEVVRGCEV